MNSASILKHLVIAITVMALISCEKKPASSPSSHALAEEDFQSFIEAPGTINIVDFSASWCGPCQQLKPVLSAVADEHSDDIQLGIVDVDEAKTLASRRGVRGIPDVRFFINGKQVEQFTGAAPKEHIEQIIEQLIAKHAAELKSTQETEPSAATPATPTPEIQPVEPSPPAPPTTTPQPAPATNPTIQPAKENPLPPGMSRG